MRPVDHCVCPFDDLSAARRFFSAYGFTVASDAAHPFGTGNACVFFADGIYLEPLAVVDDAAYTAALRQGHRFVARDDEARRLPPADRAAFAGLAFTSTDACADRARLLHEGLAEDDIVEFERALTLIDGTRADLSFRLSFASVPGPQVPSLFFCEARHRVTPDRSSLTRHANGVTGLKDIVLSSNAVDKAAAILASVTGADGIEGPNGTIRFALPNAGLALREARSVDASLLAIDTVTLIAESIDMVRAALEAGGIAHHIRDGVVLAPCPNGRGRLAFIQETKA